MNIMTIGGHRAVIQLDPEIGMFRGEFLGLYGGADFHSDCIAGLQREGEASLRIFLDLCREKGIEPARGSPASSSCASPRSCTPERPKPRRRAGVSLNQLIQRALELELRDASS